MKTIWFQIFVIVSAVFGASIVTTLSEIGLALLAGGTLGLCAILGWWLTFTNQAMKIQPGGLSVIFGSLCPVPSRWNKPLKTSWSERVIVLSCAMLFGACIRILWIANA